MQKEYIDLIIEYKGLIDSIPYLIVHQSRRQRQIGREKSIRFRVVVKRMRAVSLLLEKSMSSKEFQKLKKEVGKILWLNSSLS